MKTIPNESFGFPVNMERLERRFRGDASAGFFWEEANYFAHFAVEELSHKGYDWKFVSNIINELNKLGEQQADSDGWRPDWRKTLLAISDEIQIDQKTLHYCIALEGIGYAIESYNEGDSHRAAYVHRNKYGNGNGRSWRKGISEVHENEGNFLWWRRWQACCKK